ncbi:pyocin knob domain-containing protein [Chryseobacterium scophthalmum]|uniref:pyocin knob domain-containing protein n=1 Tax=Chryseobacterium scophthalmum TaxID=59733 RepID=UPI000C9E7E74|nr:pyocin knob domain-containing protein [Chryseobacterium scophthalmum]
MDVNYAYYNSAKGFRTVGGTAAQFLKADGSIDGNTYLKTSGDTMLGNLRLGNTSTAITRDYSTTTGTSNFAGEIVRLVGSNGVVDVFGHLGNYTNATTTGTTTLIYGYLGGTAYNTQNALRWVNGRVGIGLTGGTAPRNGYQLDVNGNLYTSGYIDLNGSINTPTTDIIIKSRGFNRLRAGGTNGNALILSGDGSDGAVYLRPQGDAISTGQVTIDATGAVLSSSSFITQSGNSIYGHYVGLTTKSADGNAVYVGGVADTVGSYIGQARYASNNQYQSDKAYASFIRFGNDGSTTFYGNTGLTANTNYSPDEIGKIDSIGVYSRSMRTSRFGSFGSYNSAETQGIWSIGSAYNVGAATSGLGTQYGLAYSFISVGGSSVNNSHQIHFTNNGVATVSVITGTGIVRANQFQKVGGLATQFLKADGSIDSNTYSTVAESNNKYFPRQLTTTNVIDLDTQTLEGVYYGYQWLNAPTVSQTVIATVAVKRYSSDWIRQEYSPINGLGTTYIRDRYNGTTWGAWRTIADREWVTSLLTSYVTQSSLNTQLGNYATLNGVQTFSNTITFGQSPIVPTGTLGTHAVNLNQLNASVPSSAQISNWNNKVDRLDNATGVGFDGGTANTPYVKHSNGSNIRVATETWTANSFAALNGDQEFTGINSFTQSPAVPFATHADDAVPFGQAEEIAQVRINDTFAEVIYKNSANDLTFDFNDFPNARWATITCKGSNFQNIRIENMPRGASLKIMNGSPSLNPIIYFDGGSSATGLGNATWAEFYRDQDSDIFKNNVNGTTII